MSYEIVSLAASVLFIPLFACLLLVPNWKEYAFVDMKVGFK
jgi:hypothetical protein